RPALPSAAATASPKSWPAALTFRLTSHRTATRSRPPSMTTKIRDSLMPTSHAPRRRTTKLTCRGSGSLTRGARSLRGQLQKPLRQLRPLAFVLVLEEHERIPPVLVPHLLHPPL